VLLFMVTIKVVRVILFRSTKVAYQTPNAAMSRIISVLLQAKQSE
jgi:hypothetical protein